MTTTKAEVPCYYEVLTRHPFVTVTEVASILRVTRQTVYNLIASGDIPSVKVGNNVRIPSRLFAEEYLCFEH